MAAWRKISRDLATSERFNQLSERARLVYFQAYPFADRDGLLPGSPTKLLAMAFPIANIPPDAIDKAAVELVGARLWELLFDANERPVYRILRFVEYQGSGHLAREAPSKFISPLTSRSSSIEFDAIAGNYPLEERRGEEMRGEESENARAHAKSEECAGNRKSHAPVCLSSSNRNEAVYQKSSVLTAIAKALDQEEFIPSPVDEKALPRFAGPIKRCPDLDAFFRWAIPPLREKKPVREHWLADALPLLNDYKPDRPADAQDYARVKEEREAKERQSWIAEAQSKGWS